MSGEGRAATRTGRSGVFRDSATSDRYPPTPYARCARLPSSFRSAMRAFAAVSRDIIVRDDINHVQHAAVASMDEPVAIVDACYIVELVRLDGLYAHARRQLLLEQCDHGLVDRGPLRLLQVGVGTRDLLRELGIQEPLRARHASGRLQGVEEPLRGRFAARASRDAIDDALLGAGESLAYLRPVSVSLVHAERVPRAPFRCVLRSIRPRCPRMEISFADRTQRVSVQPTPRKNGRS